MRARQMRVSRIVAEGAVAMAVATVAALAVMSAAAAQSLPPPLTEHITMAVDDARAFSLPEGAQVVIIGNPAVADTTTAPVQTNALTILTAKAYGTTTLQVMDDKGRQLAFSRISVGRENQNTVTVHRGTKDRISFNCAPVCAPVPALGDGAEAFATASAQIQQRAGRADKR